MKVRKVERVKLEDISGSVCAWEGCTTRFDDEIPAGWVCLLTWWAPWPEPEKTVAEVACGPFCKRDAVLCPKHASELEGLLKDIGNQLKDVAGSA